MKKEDKKSEKKVVSFNQPTVYEGVEVGRESTGITWSKKPILPANRVKQLAWQNADPLHQTYKKLPDFKPTSTASSISTANLDSSSILAAAVERESQTNKGNKKNTSKIPPKSNLTYKALIEGETLVDGVNLLLQVSSSPVKKSPAVLRFFGIGKDTKEKIALPSESEDETEKNTPT